MELQDVFLEDFLYPCITYVIKRTGLDMTPINFRHKQWTMLPYSEGTPKKGDIVLWCHGDGTTDATLYVQKDRVITTKIWRGHHYGVYEGNDVISDLVINPDGDWPTHRVRMIWDTTPDYILIDPDKENGITKGE